jgi:hypothetical protein
LLFTELNCCLLFIVLKKFSLFHHIGFVVFICVCVCECKIWTLEKRFWDQKVLVKYVFSSKMFKLKIDYKSIKYAKFWYDFVDLDELNSNIYKSKVI